MVEMILTVSKRELATRMKVYERGLLGNVRRNKKKFVSGGWREGMLRQRLGKYLTKLMLGINLYSREWTSYPNLFIYLTTLAIQVIDVASQSYG